MDFSALVQAKIAARSRGASTVGVAVEMLRQQAFERIRPLHDALAEMVNRLAEDPIFAAAFGPSPTLELQWAKDAAERITLSFRGPVGEVSVMAVRWDVPGRADRIQCELFICPEISLQGPLGCGWRYGEATPVCGELEDTQGFVVATEDMIAEFLADIAVSPVAGRFLPDVL